MTPFGTLPIVPMGEIDRTGMEIAAAKKWIDPEFLAIVRSRDMPIVKFLDESISQRFPNS